MRKRLLGLGVVLSLGMVLGLGGPSGHPGEGSQPGANPWSGPTVALLASMQDRDRSEGARIFESDCTLCHDLGGITDNPGLYTEAAFRDLVIAMVEYGAALDSMDVDTLVEYLTETYGKLDP